jgi:hypothetical protein
MNLKADAIGKWPLKSGGYQEAPLEPEYLYHNVYKQVAPLGRADRRCILQSGVGAAIVHSSSGATCL